MKTKKEQAIETFNSGFNCAQSVVSAFCEDYGLSREQAFKVSGGMGGGFRTGEICGAVSGAVVIIGLKHGQTNDGDDKAKKLCGDKTKEFISAFRAKNPAIICRDILDTVDSANGTKSETNEKRTKRMICSEMVQSAVEILEEQGY